MKFMHDIRYRFVAPGVLILLGSAFSTAFAAQAVVVKSAWARATAPGQTTAGVYLEIMSGSDAALVAAASPLAKSAEIHAMRTEGGVMKMRVVPKVELPARKTVKLAPGELHVMLVGIKEPLRERDRIPLELTIEGAGGTRSTVKVDAEVRPLTASPHSH